MGAILAWIGGIVGWVFAGVWTWIWIDPHTFGQAIFWFIVFVFVASIVGCVFTGIGTLIGSLFDQIFG